MAGTITRQGEYKLQFSDRHENPALNKVFSYRLNANNKDYSVLFIKNSPDMPEGVTSLPSKNDGYEVTVWHPSLLVGIRYNEGKSESIVHPNANTMISEDLYEHFSDNGGFDGFSEDIESNISSFTMSSGLPADQKKSIDDLVKSVKEGILAKAEKPVERLLDYKQTG